MPLEDEPLRLAQRRRLAEDLLGDRELAEVVEVAGEPGQLDRRVVRAEAARDSRRVVADALRVAAGVRVALVDRLREALRRPVVRRAVRRVRDLLEVGPQDRLGRVGADAVLAVLLRPVQRAVGEPDQLVAPGAVRRVRRDAGAHGHGADALDVERGDALDDRAGHGRRLPLVLPRQEHRELVAAEPERLAALPQPRRDLAEHEIADRMPEAVVDRS